MSERKDDANPKEVTVGVDPSVDVPEGTPEEITFSLVGRPVLPLRLRIRPGSIECFRREDDGSLTEMASHVVKPQPNVGVLEAVSLEVDLDVARFEGRDWEVVTVEPARRRE